jgi:DNA-binding SARP family transcriptional activator/tetratricopeptide (TPR) repeat protein
VEFRLLGPVEFRVDGEPVDLGPPRQRLVLAALLVDAGRPVGWETLIDRVWSADPPAGARGVLRANVARLRLVLAKAGSDDGVRLGRGAGGYVIEVDPDRVDLHRFVALVDRGRDGPADERAAWLRTALDLWRGEPLHALRGTWVEQMRDVWRQRWLHALAEWAEAEIAAGRAGLVVGPLTEARLQHPLVESLAVALMRALAATGSAARALAVYAETRAVLAEELGVDPGRDLRAAHLAIRRGRDGAPPAAAGRAGPATAAGPTVPAQLPADVVGFAGRAAELSRLDSALDQGGPEGVVIFAISGMAGVGKTALAVRWARRVADRFPDGQLYVNLRGFDPDGRAMPPAEAVRGFLDALGVPPAASPSTMDGQVGLYRSRLAGRRILVVLDNARDAEQVRPLLPGTATAVVVVTSRNQLTSLVAVDGADPLTLDVLPPDTARDLLVRRLGEDRVAADPAATDEILGVCAGLPLALRIVAARVRQTGFPLAAVVAELSEALRRLDALDAGDPVTQIRAVFASSYAALTPPAALLFRLLGRHPGPEVSVAAAASLAGWEPVEARRRLVELVRASLITEPASGRYGLHDLLRAYAIELGDRSEAEAALARLLDHYTHTAHEAAWRLLPFTQPMQLPLAPASPGVRPEPLADLPAAMCWLTAEHAVLLSVVRLAAASGCDTHTWQLAWSLQTYLHRQGHWDEMLAVGQAALSSAERLGHPGARAHAHRRLGGAYVLVRDLAAAQRECERALTLFAAAGDLVGQAYTYQNLALVGWRRGELSLALDHSQEALARWRRVGDPRGEASSLNGVAWCLTLLGDHAAAVPYCERALALYERVEYRMGQAGVLDSLGFAHHNLGHHREAVECFHRALALYRDLGVRFEEADTLARLGDTHAATGDPAAARDAWSRALGILTDLAHPDADAVRARLVAAEAEATTAGG